jgi:MoaA/NifB/PqqE/SkfB family radical SAM enzyme
MSRIAQTYGRTLALKKLMAPGVQMPSYLLMFVTNRCNARCEHCFYWRELNTRIKEELSLQEYEALARSLGPMLQITFTGGSPELRPDLPEVVRLFHRHCRPTNMTFCMLGYSTDRILQQVECMLTICPDQRIKIGISLDGLGEEHDRLRGITGLFERVVRTIRGLGELKRSHPNLRLDVGLTVHGLNYNSVEETARWARENLPIDVMKPILVRGDPFNPETKQDVCKTTYLKVVDQDASWLHRGPHAGRFTPLDYLVHAKESVQRDIIRRTSETGSTGLTCAGGRETAVIYPTGDVGGCELREGLLGNLRDVEFDFRKIWFGDAGQAFRDTVGQDTKCKGCYHHCFIAPALFRTPLMWPRMVDAAWRIYREGRRGSLH